MEKRFDICIIGGGPAGMTAAITAANLNKKVLILDHSDRLGKKILQTGNGRCNLTNDVMNEKCYGAENSEFAMAVINKFNEKNVKKWFNSLGLLLHKRDSYVYPQSDQASSVLEILSNELKRLSVTIYTDFDVTNISYKKDFLIKGNHRLDKGSEVDCFKADKLILACGSKASPKSGSDGSGYELARIFGHKITKVMPALTALRTDYKNIKLVSGVRCDGIVKICNKDGCIASERGEIQLTDYGISGIPVFQVSRYAIKELEKQRKITAKIDFLPDYKEEELICFLRTKCDNDTLTGREALVGVVNSKIVLLLSKMCGFDLNLPCKKLLKEKHIEKLAYFLKEFEINIVGYNSFDYGQVCQGGVCVDEINVNTMESKLVNNLYFAGELVDVDGICGGYNLQWAWSSGHLAGEAASK